MDVDHLKRMIKKHKSIYLFLVPAVISVILFNYKPMFSVIIAFQDYEITSGILRSPFVGLKHFAVFLSNPAFYSALRNTLGIGFLSFAVTFPIPIVLALLLNELRWKNIKKLSQTFSYMPHFISWIVVSTIVIRILDKDLGVVNNIMALLGAQRTAFMREERFFWAIAIIAQVWKESGWTSIIYLASLSSIDQNMYEAAMIDGAGRWKMLLRITLPSIATTIGLLLVLEVGSLITSGGLFDAIYNLQNPMVANAAYTLEMYSYYEGLIYKRYSYAAAITLMQSIIALLTVFAANKLYKKLSGSSAF